MEVQRTPFLLEDTVISPIRMLCGIGGAALFLPPESEAKIDLLMNLVLVSSVYILILAEDVPAYQNGDTPNLSMFLI